MALFSWLKPKPKYPEPTKVDYSGAYCPIGKPDVVIVPPKTSGGGGGGVKVSAPTPTPTPAPQTPLGYYSDPLTKTSQPILGVTPAPTKTIASQLGKSPTEFGVPLVTPTEYKRFEGTRAVGMMLPISSIEEGERLRQVTPTSGIGIQTAPSTFISRMFGPTQEQFEFTRSQIIGAKTTAGKLSVLESEFQAYPQSYVGREGVLVEETEKGRLITLTPEFVSAELGLPSIRRESILQARQEFQDLPGGKMKLPLGIGGTFYVGEKGRAILGSKLTGIAQTGIGVAEFVPSIFKTFEEAGQVREGQEFKPLSIGWKQFELGGEFSRIKYQPDAPTIKEGIPGFFEGFRSPQFQARTKSMAAVLAGGGSQIFAGGLKTGLKSLPGQISLIRPVPGLYTIPTTETTPSKFISKVRTQGDMQLRDITGFGEEFVYKSTQVTSVLPGGKISFGPAQTTLLKEGFMIAPTGRFTAGVQITGTRGLIGSPAKTGEAFLQMGTGKFPLEGVRGGISQAFTQQRYSVFLEGKVPGYLKGFYELYSPGKTFGVFRGAGVSKPIDEGITALGFGKRAAQYTTEAFEGGWIRQPIGKYTFRPSARGYEIDLGKISDVGSGVKIISPASITKTPLSKTFGRTISQQVSRATQELQLGSVQSTLGIQTQIPRQTTSQILGTTISQKDIQSITQPTKQFSSLIMDSRQQQREIQRTFSGVGSALRAGTMPRQQERTLVITIPKTEQPLILKQDFRLGFGIPIKPRTTTTTPPVISSGFFLPPIALPIFLRTRPGRGLGLTGDFFARYKPSLTAMTFDLRGVVPKRFLAGQVDPFSRRVIPRRKLVKKRVVKKQRKGGKRRKNNLLGI